MSRLDAPAFLHMRQRPGSVILGQTRLSKIKMTAGRITPVIERILKIIRRGAEAFFAPVQKAPAHGRLAELGIEFQSAIEISQGAVRSFPSHEGQGTVVKATRAVRGERGAGRKGQDGVLEAAQAIA